MTVVGRNLKKRMGFEACSFPKNATTVNKDDKLQPEKRKRKSYDFKKKKSEEEISQSGLRNTNDLHQQGYYRITFPT